MGGLNGSSRFGEGPKYNFTKVNPGAFRGNRICGILKSVTIRFIFILTNCLNDNASHNLHVIHVILPIHDPRAAYNLYGDKLFVSRY